MSPHAANRVRELLAEADAALRETPRDVGRALGLMTAARCYLETASDVLVHQLRETAAIVEEAKADGVEPRKTIKIMNRVRGSA